MVECSQEREMGFMPTSTSTRNKITRMRWPHRYKVYNVLHKSVVSVLMGITFLATFMTGVHGVHYFREIRPKQREEQRIMLEEKLAKEQAEKEQELLMSRQESETL